MKRNTHREIAECVVVPDEAALELRAALGLGPREPLRISYIPGPGNLKSTYCFWRQGEFDPNTPSIAYSTQFFELGQRLNADLQVIMRGAKPMSAETHGNATFTRVAMRPMPSFISYWREMINLALKCRSELKSFNPHIVIVVGNFFWGAFPLLRVNKARLVLTAHTTCWPMGVKKRSLRMRIENLIRRFGLAFVHSSINISPECARQVKGLSPRAMPARIAYPQQIRRAKQAEAKAEACGAQNQNIVYLGRIEENKGVFDLLAAFKNIQANHNNARLLIAGSGGCNEKLAMRIEADFADRSVEHLGRLDAAGIHELLQRAYALVCPTRTSFCEGNAAVCYEAGTHGVPVIASSVVPAREQLAPGTLVFKANSVSDLTTALDKILSDSSFRNELSAKIKNSGVIVFDRSASWGSQLYLAMLDAAKRSKK